jgi:tetratricopeptide (TPR) repeat protein
MADLGRVLEQALLLGEEERWDEMAELLRGGLKGEPDDPYLLCWLGVAERELGNEGVAYEHFKRSLSQDPLDPNLLAMVGSGLAAFDDPEAETALRTAALSGPELPAARLQYGAYLAREGLYDDALPHLQAAVRLAPEDPSCHGELGIALALKEDYEAAIAAWERALDIAPDDSWTRLLLGLVYLELRMMEEAAEALIQGAEERADDAEAQLLAGLAAATVGWDDAAHAALARLEYAEGVELELIEEAEARIVAGSRPSRELLVETVAPSALRERLRHPL